MASGAGLPATSQTATNPPPLAETGLQPDASTVGLVGDHATEIVTLPAGWGDLRPVPVPSTPPPGRTSHTRRPPASVPVAMRLPSLDHASERTGLALPPRTSIGRPKRGTCCQLDEPLLKLTGRPRAAKERDGNAS